MIKDQETSSKILSVCIIGKPNAGKSTLLNRIIGQKLSIVTPKVQTTRSIITGIITIEDVQIIMFDTPGIFEPKKKLEKAMVRCAWSSINGADEVVVIIDAKKKLDDSSLSIIARLKELNINFVVLLNKIDIRSEHIEAIKEAIVEFVSDVKFFEISALKGDGIDDFQKYLISQAKIGHWHYDKDDLTNLPIRFLASEIIREQLFLSLDQELPYNLTVENEIWKEQSDGSVKVNQVIIVTKEAHKSIILGKNGGMIKKIGIKARENIEKLSGQKIHLFLFVKVRKNWQDNPETYQYLGLQNID